MTTTNFETLRHLIQTDDVLALAPLVRDLEKTSNEVDVNGRNFYHAAIHAKAGNALLWMLDNGVAGFDTPDVQGETPLMRAAWLGYVPAIDGLVQAGADLGKASLTGGTALHHAYAGGKQAKEAVSLLLNAGANPDALDLSGNKPEQWEMQAKLRERGEELQKATEKPRLSLSRKV